MNEGNNFKSLYKKCVEENTELKTKISSAEEYINPLIEQIKTNYPKEISLELLLTHLNIIKSKLEILRGDNNVEN